MKNEIWETDDRYILVADDDPSLLKFFKIHLNKFFSKVIVVSNAREGLEKIEQNQIELVITDYKMPRFSGLQFLKKIRNIDPSIPVFIISGALLEEEEGNTIDEKSDGFLRKPFTVDQLYSYIREGLEMRKHYHDIYQVIQDKRKFRNLIEGKSFPKIDSDIDKAKVEESVKRISEIKVKFSA